MSTSSGLAGFCTNPKYKHANNKHNKCKCKETGYRKQQKVYQTGSHSTTKWALCKKCEEHPAGRPDDFKEYEDLTQGQRFGVSKRYHRQLTPNFILYITIHSHYLAPYQESYRHSLPILHLSYLRRTNRVRKYLSRLVNTHLHEASQKCFESRLQIEVQI